MKLAFQKADGSVVILGAAPKWQLERKFGPMTDEQYRAHVIDRNKEVGVIPADAVLVDLPDDWAPPDGNRAYRAAWKLNGSRVEVDMPKAREIHMGYVRNARNRKLEETDKLVAALDGGPVPAELKAQRQKLRDLPQTLDLSQATTPDELKALWPEDLR